ncbi:GntR family transcriptional regulator [Kribbella pittospori]|uniref:GntR family transcriptional regulator n=1 Tax=Kribbella pittospori TaxID=722689 RepID=A0A4R0KN65_9ACTN|nr:GntR family transcriptional regulator [Kribbella pittospori]
MSMVNNHRFTPMEEPLAAALQMSRGPVREALIELERSSYCVSTAARR